MTQAQEIVEYNKQYFFSQEFFTLVSNELRKNLSHALVEVEKTNTSQIWFERRRKLSTVDEIRKILTGSAPHTDFDRNPTYYSLHTKENIAKVVAMAKKFQN